VCRRCVHPATRNARPKTAAVRPNDNRTPAGIRRGDTLFLRLVVTRARWYPQADSGPPITVEAIGEEGKPPQISRPAHSGTKGTRIVASVRNALADSSIVSEPGCRTRPATAWDSGSHHFRCNANHPIHRGRARHLCVHHAHRSREPGLRAGDYRWERSSWISAGARTDDRIFVINIWGDSNSGSYRNALTINGKSWPYTERLSVTLGETVRARLVNASGRDHPMHLHGFLLSSRRPRRRSQTTPPTTPSQRRLAVTEVMVPGSTMRMAWYADRPGNWLFPLPYRVPRHSRRCAARPPVV
jgi:hypothetical protein